MVCQKKSLNCRECFIVFWGVDDIAGRYWQGTRFVGFVNPCIPIHPKTCRRLGGVEEYPKIEPLKSRLLGDLTNP